MVYFLKQIQPRTSPLKLARTRSSIRLLEFKIRFASESSKSVQHFSWVGRYFLLADCLHSEFRGRRRASSCRRRQQHVHRVDNHFCFDGFGTEQHCHWQSISNRTENYLLHCVSPKKGLQVVVFVRCFSEEYNKCKE